MFRLPLILFIFAPIICLLADELQLVDGSLLKGDIIAQDESSVTIQTTFAGVLTLSREQITSLSIFTPLTPAPDSEIISDLSPQQEDITSAELPTPIKPKWSTEISLRLNGSLGNTTKSDINSTLKTKRETDQDRWEASTRGKFAQTKLADNSTEKTAEELITELRYTRFITSKLGWYAREELERDRFENLRLRSTTATGISWKHLDTPTRRLEFSAGISHRYESYGYDLNNDGTPEKTGHDQLPGLDFGLTHFWKPYSWVELNNKLNYTPSFSDFGDYLIDHQSSLDFPLSPAKGWRLRLGLTNQYNAAATDKLNTTYSASLLLKWE